MAKVVAALDFPHARGGIILMPIAVNLAAESIGDNPGAGSAMSSGIILAEEDALIPGEAAEAAFAGVSVHARTV